MRSLRKPTEDAVALLVACADSYAQNRTEDRKRRLLASVQAIGQSALRYDAAAAATQLHTLPQTLDVGGPGTASRDDMSAAYDAKMAGANGPGRAIYDKLKNATSKCPLCGSRVVTQLDHHLPKKRYPAYALLPINLVPSCTDCNKEKLIDFPSSAVEETIHPYYDDYVSETWLHADVQQTAPPSLTFSVRAPTSWSALKKMRAENHPKAFKLQKYFSVEAGAMLTDIREHLLAEGRRAGASAVQEYLESEAATRRAVRLNSWEVAAYTALAASAWFCQTGYTLIG